MSKFNLKNLFISLVIIYLLPFFILAQIQEPSLPQDFSCGSLKLPSTLQGGEVGKNIWQVCLIYYLKRTLSFLYVLALFSGVIFLSWAGILYITNQGKIEQVHRKIQWGIIGIVIAILSLTIVKLIENFFLK